MWTSGFERAAVLVIDGRGEERSTSTALGAGAEIAIQEQWDTSRSLGNYYGIAAEWAGMGYWDAGKLMGLAPYGTASQPAPLRPAADGYDIAGMESPAARAGDNYPQLRRELRRYFEQHSYPFSPGDAREPMAHANFAASIQHSLEQVVQGLADGLCRDLDVDRLVIAGGVALNCTLNGVLARSGNFAEIYVPPVPHDAGVSLGAALFVHSMVAGPVPNVRLRHAYWGPRRNEPDELGPELAGAGLTITRLTDPDLPGRIAERLVDGQLVGWWQGRAEVGAATSSGSTRSRAGRRGGRSRRACWRSIPTSCSPGRSRRRRTSCWPPGRCVRRPGRAFRSPSTWTGPPARSW